MQDANTFAAVAERFINEHLAGQRRGKAGAREIRNYLVAVWGDMPIADLTPRDVKELIGKLKLTAPYQARNVFGHLRTLCAWAVHYDLLTASPMASLKAHWVLAGAEIGPRQRLLNDTEVAAFWRACGRIGYPYGPLYKLLLLTGCRLNEIAKAKWSELNLALRSALRSGDWRSLPAESRTLTVPRERFKSDAEHRVPLSDDALEIIAALPRFSGGDFMFTMMDGRAPVNAMSRAKAALVARMLRGLCALARRRGEDPNTVTLPPFIIHDTRRVVRSALSALNVDDHIAEMVLGHARKGLQRVYDQHRYEPQMRDALTRWAERLQSIVAPQRTAPVANVVKLTRKKRRAA